MFNVPIIITSKLWIWKGGSDSSWHFVTVGQDDSEMIKEQYIWPPKGFGSIPVKVTIGNSQWRTSVFPQKNGTFILPIKKVIRVAESLKAGDSPKITIEVVNS